MLNPVTRSPQQLEADFQRNRGAVDKALQDMRDAPNGEAYDRARSEFDQARRALDLDVEQLNDTHGEGSWDAQGPVAGRPRSPETNRSNR
jgi:hypothetical protein